MLSEKEIIIKLARAVLDTRLVCGDEQGECFVCEEHFWEHKNDCPILLAETVLKDKCFNCGHTKGTMICVNLKCKSMTK